MKYATFGTDGKLTGRYDSNVHSVIPPDSVEITDYLFNLSITSTSGYLEYINGQLQWTVPPPPPMPTEAEVFQATVKLFDKAIEDHLHAEAVAYGYTNIERACMYAAYPNPYWEESKSFVGWVGAVWAYCYGELLKVEQGLRPVPDLATFLTELPKRVLPSV